MNEIRKWGCASLSVLLAFGGFGAFSPVIWTVPKMRVAPVLDGRISDGEWVDAVGNCKVFPYKSSLAFGADACVWIGRDDARFYLAARFGKGPYPIKCEVKGNGGNVYGDDGFEFDFVPDVSTEKPTVFHCAITPKGFSKGMRTEDGMRHTWRPKGLRTAYEQGLDAWTIELEIPLASLEFSAANATNHALRVIRNWRRVGSEFGVQTTLEPGCTAFSSAKNIPALVFDDAAPSVQVEIGRPSGSAGYPVAVRLSNPTSSPMDLKVDLTGKAENSQPSVLAQKVRLEPGATQALTMKGIASAVEKVKLNATVTSADGRRTYYARETEFFCSEPAPKWLKPGALPSGPTFKTAYYPSYDKVSLLVDVSTVMPRPAELNARVALQDALGNELSSTSFVIGKSGVARTVWPIPDLKAETLRTGSPGYRTILSVPGLKDGVRTNAFVRHVFDWEGNSLGKSDAIPEPFKPITLGKTAEGDVEVGTVCKRHVLDGLGLWKDVRAEMTKEEYGAESAIEGPFGVMAGPMRLLAKKNGTTDVLSGSGLTTTVVSPARIKTVARLADGPLAGRAEAVWDMDGMMSWTLTLESGSVDSLRLSIPLDGAAATLMQACADGLRFNYAGAVPAGVGRVWDASKAEKNHILGDYVPYLWVGGPVAGISVFGDNDRGWACEGMPHQEIVRREDGRIAIVLNLISKPITIDSPRTIKLGFLATPVKPMEANWRGQTYGVLIGSCFQWGSHRTAEEFETFDKTDAFWKKMAEVKKTGRIDKSFIEDYIARVPPFAAKDSPEQRKYEAKLRREFKSGFSKVIGAGADGKIVFYTNGRGIDLSTDVGRTFADEWMKTEFVARKDSGFYGFAYSMDPVPSELDYEMTCLKRMLESGGCDRIYWDDVFLSSNFSRVGTDGYDTPIGFQPSTGVFNMRDQVKRCAIMQKELGYDPRHNWIHMTDTAIAPISAFAGIHYDLEDSHELSSMQYRYTRERLLAGTLGRQFGVQVALMAYYGTGDPEEVRRVERSNTGVALTFELWWRCGSKGYRDLYGKIRKWGYGDPATKVWNWWDGGRYPVKVEGIESSSVAMAKDGKALVIVSNWSGDGSARVFPDAAKLGIPANAGATDFETGEAVSRDGAALSLLLRKGDFKIIELR